MPRVNIFNAAVVSLLIVVVVLLYHIVFPFKSFKKVTDVPAQRWVQVDIIVPPDTEWLSHYIAKGDKQTGLQNKLFAEVIDYYRTKEFDAKERLVVRLKLLVVLEPGQYPLVLGRYPLRIGEYIIFQPEKYVLSGYIAKIE